MMQKIAIFVAREGRVTGTQVFSVYEVEEDAECSFFFFFQICLLTFYLEMFLYTLPTHAFMCPNCVRHPTFHFKHKN